MSQPPRKAPSQPGLKQVAQGHAKKARPSRSNSQSKPPVVKATDGYAMGSYDNEISSEPTSTPSWMRDSASDSANAKIPSSPSFPASPSPTLPPSSNNLLAPVPFHLPNYVSSGPGAPLPNFVQNYNVTPLAMPPVLPPPGLVPLHPQANSVTTTPLGSTFPNGFMVPPASAPPSSHPMQTQDAIARILALQQANASMSTSSSPLSFAAPPESSNQNSVNFSRNFAEVEQSRSSPTPSLPHSATVVNPFNTAPIAPSSVQTSPPKAVTASSPFAVQSPSAPQRGQSRLDEVFLMSAAAKPGPMVTTTHRGQGADFLFDTQPSRVPLMSSGKHASSPRGGNIHAHHNFGVPAQP